MPDNLEAPEVVDKPVDVRLFDGNDELFKPILAETSVYGEYGCGASTIWVAGNTECDIFSTDTSKEWLAKVKSQCSGRSGLKLHFSNLGPIGDWGRPLSYDRCENFSDYTDWLWSRNRKPDTVLVDGRFRVCCFLTSLLKAEPGTRILFDDYANRQKYHYVERYVEPEKVSGRQSLFIVPRIERINVARLKADIEKFRYVMD